MQIDRNKGTKQKQRERKTEKKGRQRERERERERQRETDRQGEKRLHKSNAKQEQGNKLIQLYGMVYKISLHA